MGPSKRIMLKRVVLSVLVFTAVHAAFADRWKYPVQAWIVRRAKAAGCQPFFESRVMMWGPDGPFYGDGFKTSFFNFAASWGPWWAGMLGSFLAAVVVYLACVRLERSWVLGYRGRTRCGGCGYGLAGLKEAKCPECGRVV